MPSEFIYFNNSLTGLPVSTSGSVIAPAAFSGRPPGPGPLVCKIIQCNLNLIFKGHLK